MEDKYMRAARAVEKYTDGGWDIACIAETLKAEIERPEPLLPGVRYRNTEANRERLPFPLDSNRNTKPVIVGYGTTVDIAMCTGFYDDRWTRADMHPEWFSLIPDGEVQDE